MKLYKPFIEEFLKQIKQTEKQQKKQIQEQIYYSIPLFSKAYHISPQYRCKTICLFQLTTNHLWSLSTGIQLPEITISSIQEMLEIDKSIELKECYEWILSQLLIYVKQPTKQFFLTLINYFFILEWLLLDGQDEKYISTFFRNLFTSSIRSISYLKEKDDEIESDDILQNISEVGVFNDLIPIHQIDPNTQIEHVMTFTKQLTRGCVECKFDDMKQISGKREKELEMIYRKDNNYYEIAIKSCGTTFSGFHEYDNFVEMKEQFENVTIEDIDIHMPKSYSKPIYLYFHQFHPHSNGVPILYPIPQLKDKNDYYYAVYDYFKTNSCSSIIIFHIIRN